MNPKDLEMYKVILLAALTIGIWAGVYWLYRIWDALVGA